MRVEGISFLNPSDFGILNAESEEWGNVYQRPRIQAGQIPIAPLTVWGELVSDSSRYLTERLFALSFRIDGAAGLMWGDLIYTSPPATVLMKEGLICFATNTKTRGKSEGRHWGESHYAFPNEEWIRKGYAMFKNDFVDFSRGYWIGRPLILESEL